MNDNVRPLPPHPGQVWRHVAGGALAIVRGVEHEDAEHSVTYLVLHGAERLRQRAAPLREFCSAYPILVADLAALLAGPAAEQALLLQAPLRP